MLPNEELAAKLISYRLKNGLYQAEVGKQIGISVRTVVKVERLDKVTPRTKMKVENFLKNKGEI